MNTNGKITVLLADDQQIMRDGLKSLLQACAGINVVGEADGPAIVAELASRIKPDVVNLGINLAGPEAIDSIRRLAQDLPEVKIVAHSIYLEKAFVREVLRAGAHAYVHKQHPFTELLKAINCVVQNRLYLCPKTASVVMNGYLEDLSQNGSNGTALTNREKEVLKLLANGKNSKQIALELHLSAKTVDTHRRQVMNKLHIHNLPQLTKYAIRCGLTSLE